MLTHSSGAVTGDQHKQIGVPARQSAVHQHVQTGKVRLKDPTKTLTSIKKTKTNHFNMSNAAPNMTASQFWHRFPLTSDENDRQPAFDSYQLD